jgi:tetratricopeptide (TPR) repeat protein
MNVSNRLIGTIILYLITAFICIGFLTKKIENRELAENCYQLGIKLEEMGELEYAKKSYLKAYQLNTMNLTYQKKISFREKHLTYIRHPKTLMEQKKYKEAIQYCQEKIEGFKDSPLLIERAVTAVLHLRLAQIYEEEGKKDLAEKHEKIGQGLRAERPRYRNLFMSLIILPGGSSAMSVVSVGLIMLVLGIILGITYLTKKGKRLLSVDSKFRPKEIAFVLILSVLPFFVFLFPFFTKYGIGWAIGFPCFLWLLIISPLVYFLRRRKEKGIFSFLKELLFLSFVFLSFWIVVFMFYSTIGIPLIQSWLKYY